MIWEVEFWMGILSEYFVKKWMKTNLISKLREGSIPVVIHMNTTENYTIFRSSQNKHNTRLWFNFKFVAFHFWDNYSRNQTLQFDRAATCKRCRTDLRYWKPLTTNSLFWKYNVERNHFYVRWRMLVVEGSSSWKIRSLLRCTIGISPDNVQRIYLPSLLPSLSTLISND